MNRRYTYTAGLNQGRDTPTWEGDCKVSFSVKPGEAETGPTVACGGTPATDATIEDIKLETVDGRPRPWNMYDGNIADEDTEFENWVIDKLEGSAVHIADMLAEAAEQDAYDADQAADSRRED